MRNKLIPKHRKRSPELSENSYDYYSGMLPEITIKPDSFSSFFESDFLPRYAREHPNATEEELALIKDNYNNISSVMQPKDNTSDVEGYTKGVGKVTIGGIPIKYKPKIIYNGEPSPGTAVHETTHAIRQGLLGNKIKSGNYISFLLPPILGGKTGSGYNNEETKQLNDAYNLDNFPFQNDGISIGTLNIPIKGQKDFNKTIEAGSTNTELRYKLWKELSDKLGRAPTLDEMDELINKRMFIDTDLYFINGYGRSIDAKDMDEDKIKNALIHVAQHTDRPRSFNMAANGGLLKMYEDGGSIVRTANKFKKGSKLIKRKKI